MAAAAAVVLAALGIARFQIMPAAATGWQVSRVEGAAQLGERSAAVAMPLRTGDLLRTAGGSQLSLEDSAMGRIDLGPDSEMRAATHRQLQLHRGMLHAFIWARPGQFVVDTPSARAVDLGCEYTIQVGPTGDGLLQVSLGWVAFEYEGRDSFIPAGAQCVTRRHGGPGIPFYEDAPAELAQVVMEPGQPVGPVVLDDQVFQSLFLGLARPQALQRLAHARRQPPEGQAPARRLRHHGAGFRRSPDGLVTQR